MDEVAARNFFNILNTYCVWFRKLWEEIGKTEIIKDNLDPTWVQSFEVPYKFENQEKYKVVVYDVDSFDNPDDLVKHDLLGHLVFTLHEAVTAKNQMLEKNLECSKRAVGKSGKIKINFEKKQDNDNKE